MTIIPYSDSDPRLSPVLDRMRPVINPGGPAGIWQPWETALASGVDRDASLDAFQRAVTETGRSVVRAMRDAEDFFLTEVWPDRQPAIEAALAMIEQRFAPAFPDMSARQATLLDLAWPGSIDVYLVVDCYIRGGAYSHPLTVDVAQNTGLALCETLLHEATHVADLHSRGTGVESLADRLGAHLADAGFDPRARFNIWHAVIFASSAARIRHDMDSCHVDYAQSHNLYQWFGVPNAAEIWRTFEVEGRDEEVFKRSLSQR